MRGYLLLLLALLTIDRVSASSTGATITLGPFLLILVIITLTVLLFIRAIAGMQTQEGTLPIRKLTIAALLTIGINAIAAAFIYLEI